MIRNINHNATNAKELWENTSLLKKIKEEHKDRLVNMLEAQRQFNETNEDNFSQFKRISIPIVRRLFDALIRQGHVVEGSIEPLSKWHLFEDIQFDAHGKVRDFDLIPGCYNLEKEAEATMTMVEQLAASMPTDVTKIHHFEIGDLQISPDNSRIYRCLRMNYE